MRICAGPFLPGTVRRKKSPNPTRYIRTRMLPAGAPALPCPPALAAGPAPLAALLAGFLRRCVDFAGVLCVVFLAGFVFAAVPALVARAVLVAALRVAIGQFTSWIRQKFAWK